MINHIRTLLLNEEAVKHAGDLEEYVPEEFRKRTEPHSIAKFRYVFFGETPTREELNYRLHQCMVILHTTPALVRYVIKPDPRITYWPLEKGMRSEVKMPPLPQVVANLAVSLDEGDLDDIFGKDPEEPYKTFRELWEEERKLPLRLGSLLLGIAHRMETQPVCRIDTPPQK
jgi:hypothetical protein